MSNSLIPRSFFKRLPSPFASWQRFPNLWEEDEELGNFFEQQTGLSIYEDQQNVYVEASLPGLKSNEIEINLDQGILWIKGEKKEEEQNKDKKFYRKALTNFSYRIALPGQIDENKEPAAAYKDGILKITFNKAKQGQSKKITVKGS